MQLVVAINDGLEVLELRKCAYERRHLAIIDTAVVETHPVDFTLQVLGSTIKALTMART